MAQEDISSKNSISIAFLATKCQSIDTKLAFLIIESADIHEESESDSSAEFSLSSTIILCSKLYHASAASLVV